MKATIHLFMILVTMVVMIFSWVTHQLESQKVLIAVRIAATLAVFLLMNLLDRREEQEEKGDARIRTADTGRSRSRKEGPPLLWKQTNGNPGSPGEVETSKPVRPKGERREVPWKVVLIS